MAQIPNPKSTWREGVAIATGAVLLVVVALAGLAMKAVNNAFNTQRAEAIAKSIMDYKIPGGSRGVLGLNIGGSKLALVVSLSQLEDLKQVLDANDPAGAEIQLWIARVPVERETDAEDSPEKADENLSLSSDPQAGFNVTETRAAEKEFCGRKVPVKIARGELAVTDQAPPVPALRYDTSVLVDVADRDEYQVTLIAIGRNLEQKAEAVFNSLQCKPFPKT
jgi:hypothetical protein